MWTLYAARVTRKSFGFGGGKIVGYNKIIWGKYLWKLISLKIFYEDLCAIIQFEFIVFIVILDFSMGYFMARVFHY